MSTTDNKFNTIAKKQAKKKPAPLSLRLTFEERTRLEELAGDEPLGSYIKRKVFDGQGTSNKRARSKLRRPIKDDASLAKLLALLGGSRITNNLNQLANEQRNKVFGLNISNQANPSRTPILSATIAPFAPLIGTTFRLPGSGMNG